MPTRKMPKPGEKNAPTFDTEKPEELGRFFERIEDWFEDEGIMEDLDKMRRIVRYLDPDSESQWKALSTFEKGTFEEFRAQVMSSYPKAEEVMKGSVTALKRKIREIGPVAQQDRDDLLSLIRIMTAEVLKLKQIQPPIHTNRELVDLFLKRLTGEFAALIANKLSVQRLIAQHKNKQVARNTEDMFDIEEVMDIAKETSLEYANPFGKYLGVTSGPTSEVSTKLEEAVASLKDTISTQQKHNQQFEQRLANLHNAMNQPRYPAAQPGYNRELVQGQMQGARDNPIKCFYCRGPHKITDCEHVHRHLDMKWVVKTENGNGVKLPGGRYIPRDGEKTMKEVVEDMNAQKPGVIPMSRIADKAALYQEQPKATSYVQAQGNDDDTLRSLTELIQRVGLDRLQEMLSPVPQESFSQEDQEWHQNFDLVQ
jgi:hypothetical protein